MTIRVVVADDQATVRAGLVLILEDADDIEVVGQAGDGETAVALGCALRPDVVVMDVRMPRLDGISATRRLVAEAGVDVLVLTTFDHDEYVFGALRAGAAGFLLKDTDAAGLVAAVRLVARGDGVIAPEVTRRLIATFARPAPGPRFAGVCGTPPGPAVAGRAEELTPRERFEELTPRERFEELTPRERDVLRQLGVGLSNQEIAERLTISESTAKTHVSRVLAKLGLRSRVQAAILARELDPELGGATGGDGR